MAGGITHFVVGQKPASVSSRLQSGHGAAFQEGPGRNAVGFRNAGRCGRSLSHRTTGASGGRGKLLSLP